MAEKERIKELETILDECFEKVIGALGAGYSFEPSREYEDLANRVHKVLQNKHKPIWTQAEFDALAKEVKGKEITLSKSAPETKPILSIPQLATMLDEAKKEKAKTVIPKFTVGQYVNWIGYSDHCGEIEDIEISISDDGEPTVTYFVGGVGQYWESELELTK